MSKIVTRVTQRLEDAPNFLTHSFIERDGGTIRISVVNKHSRDYASSTMTLTDFENIVVQLLGDLP